MKKRPTELPIEDYIRRTRKHAGRFAVPPYAVVFSTDIALIANLPNEIYQALAVGTELLNPKTMQETLLSIRRDLRWSRTTLALALGVSPHTLRRWETGERKPNGAARRLVWLVDRLTHSRKGVASFLDILVGTFGQAVLDAGEEGSEREAKAEKNAPLP